MNEKVGEKEFKVEEENLAIHWWGQDICNFHQCAYNGGGWCRVMKREKTNVWDEEGKCKISEMILEPEIEKLESE